MLVRGLETTANPLCSSRQKLIGDCHVIAGALTPDHEVRQAFEKIGASDRIRTGDIQIHNLAL